MKIRTSSFSGFTIVELIIVVTIVAILATVVTIGYTGVANNARDKSLLSDMDAVESELARYATKNNGVYDASLNWDSSAGSNSKILFTPSSGNVIIVSTTETGYCIKAFNPKSNSQNLANAQKRGDCTPYWIALSSNIANTCGISSENKVYCWGNGMYGKLGNNGTTNSSVPVAVSTSGLLQNKIIKSISVTNDHSCVLASDDSGYCWGNDLSGYLGTGSSSTHRSSVPVAISMTGLLAGKSLKSISVGTSHTCVIASDSRVYCWGYNPDGRLGDGTTTNSPSTAVAVSTSGVLAGKTINAVSVQYDHSCVIASDGNAYCWGYGSTGSLGYGSSTSSSVPVAVSTAGVLAGKSIKSVSTSFSNSCAIASDDNVYCWGAGTYGALGNSSTARSLIPVAVTTSGALSGKTVKSMVQGQSHTCVIASDNNAYCWGRNNQGQLGNGTTSDSSVPVAVSMSGLLSGKTIKSISAGHAYTCVIASDNNAYCWGYNGDGQLGNNSTVNSTQPVLVDSSVFSS